MTLTELTVTVTIIGILGAVVATGVSGSTTSANESSRAQFYAAVQGAVDTFAQGHLPPDGDLTKATYAFSRSTETNKGATVSFATTGKPGETAAASETRSWDWYGANGKFLTPQPGTTADGGTVYTTEFFVYVDLYSGGINCTETSGAPYGSTSDTSLKTDIRCLGFLKVPGGASKSFGQPGIDGKVIRCLFVSNSTTTTVKDQNSGNNVTIYASPLSTTDATPTAIHGGSDADAAKAAVGATKGKVLACRDQDPGGSKASN